MTLRIEQSHFDSNFEGQEGEFQLEGGFYKKIVPEEDLDVSFDDVNDGKFKCLGFESRLKLNKNVLFVKK